MYREKSSGERTQPWGAPVLIVWVLNESLSVRKLVIHWQTEEGTESCVSLFWRVSGMMVLKAELLVCPDAAGWSSVPCWLHHPQTCLLCRKTADSPVRVQWRPSDKPKPVFQMISWPFASTPFSALNRHSNVLHPKDGLRLYIYANIYIFFNTTNPQIWWSSCKGEIMWDVVKATKLYFYFIKETMLFYQRKEKLNWKLKTFH